MTIATVDDIASGLSGAQFPWYAKNITAAKSVGAFQSWWLGTGTPAAGAAPPVYTNGSGYTSDKSTTGALAYTNGAVQNWLARISASGSQAGTLIFYDRLWSCSGMGFAASTYSVTTPGSLPARITDNGLNAELWVEQYVAAGAASGTLTANYLDSAGSSKSGVIAAVVSAPVIGQLQQIPLANNLGVKQLTSVVNNATWTSGSWGMVIMQRILTIPVPIIGVAQVFDWATALRKLPADACIMAAWLANVTTAPLVTGEIAIIDK